MATKKTSKKAPVKAAEKKTAAAKTETKTTVKRVVAESTAKSKRVELDSKLPNNLINIVICDEVIGTFILTLAALFASDILSSMYVGFALMFIVAIIGNISGTRKPSCHVWSMDNAQAKDRTCTIFTGAHNSSVQWRLSYLSAH
ncbi:hypothetical protein KOY49_03275 [Candidatus Minimicrobia vallesae]|uniref:Uncharacterized protein n=1 Tax=Candidatus Minimicrobia vallesae TaxID=2841264 RepID=A0A8F1MB59_9BACT|nr:hypothetical protein [Candidatus Minimicrobia vallesae]QWQ31865.1 hypothetical protein KOY49_03275 [Candidatus Minimicrobia vallesae]